MLCPGLASLRCGTRPTRRARAETAARSKILARFLIQAVSFQPTIDDVEFQRRSRCRDERLVDGAGDPRAGAEAARGDGDGGLAESERERLREEGIQRFRRLHLGEAADVDSRHRDPERDRGLLRPNGRRRHEHDDEGSQDSDCPTHRLRRC